MKILSKPLLIDKANVNPVRTASEIYHRERAFVYIGAADIYLYGDRRRRCRASRSVALSLSRGLVARVGAVSAYCCVLGARRIRRLSGQRRRKRPRRFENESSERSEGCKRQGRGKATHPSGEAKRRRGRERAAT